MNRIVNSAVLLLLVLVMLFVLPACQNTEEEVFVPESSLQLWEKIDATMDTLESYVLDNTAMVTYYYMGYEMNLSLSGRVINVPGAHYDVVETLLSSPELELDQTMKMVRAFYDGKIYMETNDGTYDQKLCSDMTYEEYQKIKTDGLTGGIDITACTKSLFEKNESGDWNMKFSGYTKKSIDTILRSLDLTNDQLGAPVEDMQVTLTADHSFRARKIELSLIFAEAEGEPMPEFSVVVEYSMFNEAEFKADALKIEEHTQVSDVRILEMVQSAVEQRQASGSGQFTLDIKNTLELMSHVETSYEKDDVSYGKKNGAFYYDISVDINGQQLTMQYRNGQQTVTTGDETKSASQSETDAKLFVHNLINHAKYTPAAVTEIEEKGDGVYLLRISQEDASDYSAYFVGIDVEPTSVTQDITFAFENNLLMKIESIITINGIYSYDAGTAPITTVIESVVSFEEKLQEE